MTSRQKELIKTTWQQIDRMSDKLVGGLFYDRLFSIAPEVRSLFLTPVPEQSKKLMLMLRYTTRSIDQPEELNATLSKLAQRHTGYRVQRYQYMVVGNALLWTLEKCLGDLWSDEAEEAWASYYRFLSEAMTGSHPIEKTAA